MTQRTGLTSNDIAVTVVHSIQGKTITKRTEPRIKLDGGFCSLTKLQRE
jgi:hypothetical protein